MKLRRRRPSRKLILGWILLSLAFLPSCGDDDGTKPTSDATPPARVEDLAVVDSAAGVITLIWTAPGDDGNEGQATRYDIRRSTTLASEAEWNSATVVDSSRVPKMAGEPESLEVGGLDDGAWHFALKTADEVPNWSEISNIASATLVDTIPPGQVTDLAAVVVTAVTVKLAWTAPGDDGAERTASAYDLRYALTPITEETWDDALPVEGMPAPEASGSLESFTITGLAQATAYSFALRTIDNAGNESHLSNVVTKSTASLMRLTFTPAAPYLQEGAYQPDWSPDGETIAFLADWEEGFPWPEVHLIPVGGGPAVRLTYEPVRALRPTWSPDGTRLAYGNQNMSGTTSILIMDALPGSLAVPIITGNLHEQLGNYACSWSPSGERIAFNLLVWSSEPPDTIVRSDFCTVDVQGGQSQVVISDSEPIRGADWSPDGSRIVFSSARSGNYDIWVVPASGGAPQQLTTDPADDTNPAWSPDGSRIAFRSKRTGNGEIWIMSATGEDPNQLTFGSGSKGGPAWSPDGHGIAFSSFEDISDIWLLRWE